MGDFIPTCNNPVSQCGCLVPPILLFVQTEAEGGVLVEELDDATHAVLRHQEQPEYQQAIDLMTVNVVPPEWVLHSATAHERQPEVGGCAGWEPADAVVLTARSCQIVSCLFTAGGLLSQAVQRCRSVSSVWQHD
jgi:hypothetical protein